MPAPKGNTNASRPGYAALIRVRVPSEEDFDLINESLDTAERGRALLNSAKETDMKDQIVVDIDLSDDAMGVENANTVSYLDSLYDELAKEYTGAEISFTHAGTGRISVDGRLDSDEEHVIGHIITTTWQDWLEKQ